MLGNLLHHQKLTLVIFLMFCFQVLAFYPSQGGNGYYGESENGIPGDSSCKTCLDGISGETGEDFMRFNEVTRLGETGAEGEYYDPVGDNGLAGNSVGTGACASQSSCFEGPSDKLFDIEALDCVDSCVSDNKTMITSEKMNIGKIGKTLNIYIDPYSQEPIEFGTFKYPYRTFKSAASEILNHYSNTQAEVTIYVKDGYIEMDTLYFINMTNVKITAHPEYKIKDKRAQISFTSKTQHGISKKARFHLLKDTSIDYYQFVAIEDTEMPGLSKDKMGIMFYRTSLEISEAQFHSNELKHFGAPVYLQDKNVKFCKT